MSDEKKDLATKHRKYFVASSLDDDTAKTVVYNLGRAGMTQAHVATIFGMSRRTFQRRLYENSELFDAYRRGLAEALKDVSDTAFTLASSGKDPTTTRWWMERMGDQVVKEIEESEQIEDEVIDVTPQNKGPMRRKEILEHLERDPMLKEDEDE